MNDRDLYLFITNAAYRNAVIYKLKLRLADYILDAVVIPLIRKKGEQWKP